MDTFGPYIEDRIVMNERLLNVVHARRARCIGDGRSRARRVAQPESGAPMKVRPGFIIALGVAVSIAYASLVSGCGNEPECRPDTSTGEGTTG